MNERVALIVGTGPGISAAFAEALVADGYQVALAALDRSLGEPEVVLVNPSARVRGDLLTIKEAARRMLPKRRGSIFFTGATAAIARSYMAALAQPPGAWSWELELRSYTEPF